jgi:hypothetical protein
MTVLKRAQHYNKAASIYSLDELRTMSRELAVSSQEADRLPLARAFGFRMVAAWWKAITASASSPEPLRHLWRLRKASIY